MIIGFTGTRMGLTPAQTQTLMSELHRLNATELHHGDCQGADAQAHQAARQLGIRVVGHPPIAEGLRAFCECDEARDPAPYVSRDHSIVLETQMLLAGPDGPERRRSGTWLTVRYARRLRRPVGVITPDGLTTWTDSVYS